MKKVLIAAALVGAIGFAGLQTASAHGDSYAGWSGYCGDYTTNNRTLSEEDAQKFEAYRTETETIRKEIVVKGSELSALYRQDNPDEKKVARLTGELYDLKTTLGEKAESKGLTNNSTYEHGPGMMWGSGWNRGGHMMGW